MRETTEDEGHRIPFRPRAYTSDGGTPDAEARFLENMNLGRKISANPELVHMQEKLERHDQELADLKRLFRSHIDISDNVKKVSMRQPDSPCLDTGDQKDKVEEFQQIIMKQQKTINDQKETMKGYQNVVTKHEQTIRDREDTIDGCNKLINQQVKDMRHKERIMRTKAKIANEQDRLVKTHENTIRALKEDIQSLELKNCELENTIKEFKDNLQSLKLEKSELEETLASKLSSCDPTASALPPEPGVPKDEASSPVHVDNESSEDKGPLLSDP